MRPGATYSLLRLPWLAPDIATAIINGRKPPQLTAQTLMRLTPRLPASWAEQRKLLGFRCEQIGFCEFPPPITSASPDVSCSAREKSQPRNGAGEIFITAAAEITRESVSATNRFGHETGKPRKFARK
jgi:hypothetical protein